MTTFNYQKLTFLAIILLSITHINNAQYVLQRCSFIYANYTTESDYGINVNKTLIELASSASSTYFNTSSIGSGLDKVDAHFSCRYDMTPKVCQDCVEIAAKNAPACLRSIESIQYYQQCTVQYSNTTTLSIGDETYSLFEYGIQNVTNLTSLMPTIVQTLVGDTISEFDVSSRYYATSVTNYSASEMIYALAQCNENLSSDECSECLEGSFGRFRINHQESSQGQLFMPRCRLSYKLTSETMTPPYNFTVPVKASDNVLTPPMSSAVDDSAPPPPPAPPRPNFSDEAPPPAGPSAKPSTSTGSTGFIGMSTAMAKGFMVVLCLGLLIQSS